MIFYENCHVRNGRHAEIQLGVFDNQRVFETMHNRTGLTITAVYRQHFCGKFVLSHSHRRLFLLLLLLSNAWHSKCVKARWYRRYVNYVKVADGVYQNVHTNIRTSQMVLHDDNACST